MVRLFISRLWTKQIFLQLLNLPKFVAVGLPMVEGLFSFFLFYCGSSINQYAGQRTLKDVFWASLLLLELTYFKTIVLPNHFRMLHVFMEKQHFIRRTISLVFCSSSFSI